MGRLNDAPVALDDTDVLLRRYARHHDFAARDEVLARFTPLAQRLVRRYQHPSGESRDDLEQVAMIGLLKALDRFECDRGFTFATFATPTILGELRRYFRDATWRVHVTRDLKERIQAVEKAIAVAQERLGRSPSPVEVAEHTALDEDAVLEALAALHQTRVTSLDTPRRSEDPDEQSPLLDTIGGIDPHFHLVEYGAGAQRVFDQLPERDRRIIHLRFVEDLTQSEIGQRVGLSQMQVSRVLARSTELLRDAARAQA